VVSNILLIDSAPCVEKSSRLESLSTTLMHRFDFFAANLSGKVWQVLLSGKDDDADDDNHYSCLC